MHRRQFFFNAAAAALTLRFPGRAGGRPQSAPPLISPADLQATHDALFQFWFPLKELKIPPDERSEITKISSAVSAGMYQAFTESSLLELLEGMTAPSLLPFYRELAGSSDPAVQAFLTIPGGFGVMPRTLRRRLFSFLFNGTAGPASTQLAMVLREAYMSGIWDLPLAVPICGITAPKVFVDDPAKWAQQHAPKLPPSRLHYDASTQTVSHLDGAIDYLIVGSGPAGATIAHELQQAGKRVVLIEKGPFVVWGSMDTRSYSSLMFRNNAATTVNNSVILRSGETLGGGTTVNIDLAFSPLKPDIQQHIHQWIEQGLIDGQYYTDERVAAAYEWVTANVPNYHVTQEDLNPDNLALWNGSLAYGAQPSRYNLNRFELGTSPSPVDDKMDAARTLLYPALEDESNPLSVIPDAVVNEILFAPTGDGTNVIATGISFTAQQPWTTYGNTLVDPSRLNIPAGTTVTIAAEHVIVSAGTIGTTRLLAQTARKNPLVNNPRIGVGLVLHPSQPLVGLFDHPINMLEGLDAGTFDDTYAVSDGFIIETMNGLPQYGAILLPGDGVQVFDHLKNFNYYAGFGVAVIDTPSDLNFIEVDEGGEVSIHYDVTESDKIRFRKGIATAVRMMFLAGAKQVVIPSNENYLQLPNFDPMTGVYLDHIEQADGIEQNLQFTPNRTLLTAAHLQAANKIGPSYKTAVVSTSHRLWNVQGGEVPNVYVMDSSIFPTSVGANPMQSIYTFAKIFCDRLIAGM
ncbi:MAG: GMC family oxidoreductase [Acidobacteriaceae bacterium]|nr:GMC family oxidoreductase [Acidobacteriaceae bacterium]